jgi:hypothetical protein
MPSKMARSAKDSGCEQRPCVKHREHFDRIEYPTKIHVCLPYLIGDRSLPRLNQGRRATNPSTVRDVFYGRVVTYVNDDELVGSLELVGHLVDAGLGTDIILARRVPLPKNRDVADGKTDV